MNERPLRVAVEELRAIVYIYAPNVTPFLFDAKQKGGSRDAGPRSDLENIASRGRAKARKMVSDIRPFRLIVIVDSGWTTA